MEDLLKQLRAQLPERIDFYELIIALLIYAGCSLVFGLFCRMVMGKRSPVNHAVSSAFAILFIYGVTIFIYTFRPWNLEHLLSPLPFVAFGEEHLFFLPFQVKYFSQLCQQILSLFILAFLVNFLDSVLPQGEKIFQWFLYRFLTVVLAMAMHLLVNWAVTTYVPNLLVNYAPVILLAILVSMLLIGSLNLLVGLAISTANPIIGGLYTFFFSNVVGKQLTKAAFTTIILCVVFYLLGHFELYALSISETSLISYLPYMGIVLLMWFLLGHFL